MVSTHLSMISEVMVSILRLISLNGLFIYSIIPYCEYELDWSVFHPEMKSKKGYGIDTSDPASKKTFLQAFNFNT